MSQSVTIGAPRQVVTVVQTQANTQVVSVVQTGPAGKAGANGINSNDQPFRFTQSQAASVWTVQHNLGRFPTVTVVDSAGNLGFGSVVYIDSNNLVINFGNAFAGDAYLS